MPQFSLASLFVVTTATGVLLAFAMPAYRAAQSIEWSDPILGYCVGFAGLALAAFLAIGLLRR